MDRIVRTHISRSHAVVEDYSPKGGSNESGRDTLTRAKNEPSEIEPQTAPNAPIYIDLEGLHEIREIENRQIQSRPSPKANPHEGVPIYERHSTPAKTNPEQTRKNGT